MTEDEQHEAMGAMIHRGKVEQATAGRDYHNEIRAERDVLREALKVAREAIKGVVRVADRKTIEFDAARVAIAQIDKLIGGENG